MSVIQRTPNNEMPNADKSTPSLDSLCEAVKVLLPSYSTGIATEDERRLVQAALPLCPEAQDILEDYSTIGDSLLAMTPINESPPPLGSLLERAARTPTAAPVSHGVGPSPLPAQPQAALPELYVLPPPERHTHERRRFSITPLTLIASVVLLAFLNVYWIVQSQQVNRDQLRLLELIASTRPAEPGSLQLALDTSNYHRELAPVESLSGQATASFAWNSSTRVGALVVSGLPEIDTSETYQLWVVDSEHALSLGTFRVNDDGTGVLVFQSPEPIENFEHIGVSTEPAGGSPNPTSEHLVLGNI